MPTTARTANRKRLFAEAASESDRLVCLVTAANTHHNEIANIHQVTAEEKSRALDHAREAGEALHRAKAVCKQSKKQDNSLPCWIDWVESEFEFSRQTASTYVRIFANWNLLSDLQGEERSIRGAIRFLNQLLGQTLTRERKRKKVLIAESDFITLAKQHGFADIADNLEQGRAFFNAVSKLARFPKDIVFGKETVKDSPRDDYTRGM
jgi:hypothetical protein